MNYKSPLAQAQFLKRYKRFFADVTIDGKVHVAHVPNTGSLKGLCDLPTACRISHSDNPKRKLAFTLEQVHSPTSWVGVNTHSANTLVEEAHGRIPHWSEYITLQREVKINPETRLDFCLINKTGAKHYVEVKNVTLAEPPTAFFPDAVTTRGQKHIEELIRLVEKGHSGELIFVVQREDCTEFSPADFIDATYGKLLRQAKKSGVLITAYATRLALDRITLLTDKILKLRL